MFRRMAGTCPYSPAPRLIRQSWQRGRLQRTAPRWNWVHQYEAATAGSVVSQRESQLALAEKDIQRTQQLVDKGFISAQKLDVDRTNRQSALDATRAASSQLRGAQSATEAARAVAVGR